MHVYTTPRFMHPLHEYEPAPPARHLAKPTNSRVVHDCAMDLATATPADLGDRVSRILPTLPNTKCLIYSPMNCVQDLCHAATRQSSGPPRRLWRLPLMSTSLADPVTLQMLNELSNGSASPMRLRCPCTHLIARRALKPDLRINLSHAAN